MKNKVLIIGPIGDFGGREIEVSIIAKALEVNNDVMILSTGGNMTNNSFALKGLKNTKWKSVWEILYKSNLVLRILSWFSKKNNKSNLPSVNFVNNSIAKKIFNIENVFFKVIKNEIFSANVVILCVQLTSKYFKEIVEYCYSINIKCIVRTTGTINLLQFEDLNFLSKVSLFIHHSEENASNLNRQIKLPYIIIDQCSLCENQLLELPLKKKKPLQFGYLGRLTSEKGILSLIDSFSKTNMPLLIAGEGVLEKEIKEMTLKSSNCKYIGKIDYLKIADFFQKIDVLVISSYEESGPLVGIEALAAGKIIISTKVGAMEERMTGLPSFWFDIGKIITLEEKINKINDLSEQELEALSKMYKKRYIDNYKLDLIIDLYKKNVEKFIIN
jgi:glycosyltransferase involved in cell wall biosynthesis